MKLIVVKAEDAVHPDWWIIERAEHDGREWEECTLDGLSARTLRSARFVKGEVEGTGYEMHALAQAIKQEGQAAFKRCQVTWMATGCLIGRPRGGADQVLISHDEARELAADIRCKIPTALIAPGQLCRDDACKTFRIAIVLEPSRRDDKFRVCRWHPSYEPQGGHWCAPHSVYGYQLQPISQDFDLTSRRGLVVAAARRAVVDGLVRWQVSSRHNYDKLTEVHYVGVVRP